MRIDLKVPFEEKDQAKALGAWWDKEKKVWWVDGDFIDSRNFSKWLPKETTITASDAPKTRFAEDAW